jgi:hypothetical protein
MWTSRLPIILMVILGWQADAQEQDHPENPSRITYQNRFSAGVLFGGESHLVTGSLTTIHGIAMRNWAIGIGTGIEGYERWRIIPVFASMTYNFGTLRDNDIFVQLDAGHSFGRWLQPVDGVAYEDRPEGLMINSMVGYQIAKGKLKVYISAGYKLQRLNYAYRIEWWDTIHYNVKENLNRFFLQIGFGLK